MFNTNTRRIDDRIVSLSQPWIRPIKRGKQNAEIEFGAKVEMSDVNRFLRIEHLSGDAFNESTSLQESVENYRQAYANPSRYYFSNKRKTQVLQRAWQPSQRSETWKTYTCSGTSQTGASSGMARDQRTQRY